jgi:hypothetical protein
MVKKFKDYLEERQDYKFRLHEEVQAHIISGQGLFNNHYRMYSEAFFDFIEIARTLNETGQVKLEDGDLELLQTNLGEWSLYEGQYVPLDAPMLDESNDDDVELGKPKRGGPKKFYVYVKSDNGNVKKVTFGDTTGLTAKINDPEARKNFAARHNCSQQKDRTTAAYWSCNLPRYAKQLGLSGGGNYYW